MIKLVDLLLEKKGDIHKYGCVMLYCKFPYIRQIHKQINPNDLYEEEGDRSFGFEDEPHITILYGLEPEVKGSEIRNLLWQVHFPAFIIDNVSVFENENYDVLKFDVEGGMFAKLNQKLKRLPHEPSDFEYHPHLTICYLKKGLADKYIKKFKGLEYKLLPLHYVYSMPDGSKKRYSARIKPQK